MNEQPIKDFDELSKRIIGSRVIGIITPCVEYNWHSNSFWLEESQGDTSDNIELICQIKLIIDCSDGRIEPIIGLKRTAFESEDRFDITYNLNYKFGENLAIIQASTESRPWNLKNTISGMDFQVSEIELMNDKENLVNLSRNGELRYGNVLIIKSIKKDVIFIQALESDDQENCLKLKLTNDSDNEISLAKKYQFESIKKWK